MDPINKYDLRQILIDSAKLYQTEMRKEINMVTQILDSKHQLKTFTTQKDLTRDLMNYYQVNDVFIEVEKDMISAIVQKCEGNP